MFSKTINLSIVNLQHHPRIHLADYAVQLYTDENGKEPGTVSSMKAMSGDC